MVKWKDLKKNKKPSYDGFFMVGATGFEPATP